MERCYERRAPVLQDIKSSGVWLYNSGNVFMYLTLKFSILE